MFRSFLGLAMVLKTAWKHVFQGIFFPASAEVKEFVPPKDAAVEGAVHLVAGGEAPGMFSVKNIPLLRPPKSFYARHPRPWAEVEKDHLDAVMPRFMEDLDTIDRTLDCGELRLLLSEIREDERLAALAEFESSVLTAARFNMHNPTVGHHNIDLFHHEISYYLLNIGELPIWW